MAGHRRDPVTQLMRERKQFIVPNKCSISKYQAATTLLIPLAITFRFYATANSDFKLFLPARFSFSVRRGKPKKGLTDCCKQEPCKFSQFRPCQSSRTPQQVILTSIAFKKKKKSLPQQFLHQGCTKQSFPGSRAGSTSQPSWAQHHLCPLGCGSPADPTPGASRARAHRLPQQCITADKVNPVINTECRSRLQGVIHNSYCTSPIHCTRRDCLEVDSGNIRR